MPSPRLRLLLVLGLALLTAFGRASAQDDAPTTDGPSPAASGAPDAAAAADPDVAADTASPAERATFGNVYVIPVHGEISPPSLYVLRRGLKDAIEKEADFVLLDMNTPGGRADVMIEMMEALEKFPGTTATFVNDEAGSAGALIAAVTDEIYFAPTGVMGAAELISGTGADVAEGLKRKMTSYINAKVRALSGSDPRRADVLKAMTSPDFELKIDDTVIKPKGELLTVTAAEAVAAYGDPPRPLLSEGIADSIDALFESRFPAGTSVTRLETTWSEDVAQWLTALSPVLMGLGLLALFIEFKTPGFGIFGVAGGALLLIVFFGHYIAGLSGHEPALVFALGMVLVVLELLVFPGTLVAGLLGVVLMLGALLWSMADLWPNEPIEFSGDVFRRPLINLVLGLLVAIGGAAAILRFLPRGWFWDRMVLASAIGGSSGAAADAPSVAGDGPLVGRRGVAVTALFPSGQVEIDGRRYEARLEVGAADPGARVVVTAQREFGLIVELDDATA